MIDDILEEYHLPHSGNTLSHWITAAVLLILTLLLRRVVTGVIFARLKRMAARTTTRLDDRLFPALEGPVVAFVTVIGLLLAVKVLKLTEPLEVAVDTMSTIAFCLVIFWAMLRTLDALLDHAHEVATRHNMGVAAFMPWIKKALIALVVIIGALLTARSLGYEVQPFLAGLGIGGLAFALAAQDTIANLFGSVVVAIDQPFIIGEAVKIASSEGVVEDIGLRSTRLRTPSQNLIIIPNKLVAAESITNNSRFIQRRAEQVISLTYDTTAEAMDGIVTDIRALILAEAEVDPKSVMVYFRDYSASSLDIWVVYNSKSPDFQLHMRLRQRINLAMMRAVAARGLAFAFPTQTMVLDGPVAKQLAGQGPDGRSNGERRSSSA